MEPRINPKEQLYWTASLVISSLAYLALLSAVVRDPSILGFALGGIGVVVLSHGAFIGRIRGGAVRVSSRQFPEVHQIASRLARQMGFDRMPAIYVQQAGGVLNAFATRFFGGNLVVIFSDVLELAYESGESALAFVIAHELGHLHRHHPTWRIVLLPAMLVPFLGTAYSRACEYTCDSYGSFYAPADSIGGLMVLAAGKRLYRRMNLSDFREQATRERGFWIWLAEIFETHPLLAHRVDAALAADRTGLAAAPIQQTEV